MNDAVKRTVSPRSLTTEQIRQLAASTQHRVLAAKAPEDISGMSVIQLDVSDVLFYEKNPRKHINAKYDEIMASIRVRGLESELFVTKRPGAAQYVLARGGKTRLLILQALKKEDPQKWSKHEFREIPYVSESHILAAHIVENTSRADMCFYDTALSILEMRDQLVAELGKDISQRELAKQLKERGIEVSREDVNNAVFVVEFLGELGAWQDQIKTFQVHNVIRPAVKHLQTLWLLWPDHSTQSFQVLVDQGVSKAVASVPEYSADALVESVIVAVAEALAISTSALSAALASHRELAIKSVDEFEARLQAPAAPTKTAEPSALKSQGFDAAGFGSARTDVPGIGGVSVVTGLSPRVPPAAKPKYQSEDDSDGDGGADGVSDTVGHRVTRNSHAGISTGPLTPEELAALEQESPQSLAHSAFRTDLMAFAVTAGIGGLVTPSAALDLLPYGFYVELPAHPGQLGESIEDIAIQAWWMLAGLSEQTTRVEQLAAHPDALQDSGAEGYKHLISHPDEAFGAAVLQSKLGAENGPRFDVLLHLITSTAHPLHESLMALLYACKHVNDLRRQA